MTLSLSLATFCRPNSSFVFDFLQHYVHIGHTRNYDKQKAVVVVETSLILGLPAMGNARVRERRECISEA